MFLKLIKFIKTVVIFIFTRILFSYEINLTLCYFRDKSIPSLENISRVSPEEHEKLSKLIENQINFENSVKKQVESQYTEYPNPETECKAPRYIDILSLCTFIFYVFKAGNQLCYITCKYFSMSFP